MVTSSTIIETAVTIIKSTVKTSVISFGDRITGSSNTTIVY